MASDNVQQISDNIRRFHENVTNKLKALEKTILNR